MIKQIQLLKIKSGLTAAQLSQKSGVPLATVHKLLSGETTNPKLETLNAVLAALSYQLEIRPLDDSNNECLSELEWQLITLYRQLSGSAQNLFNGLLLQFMHYEKKSGFTPDNTPPLD